MSRSKKISSEKVTVSDDKTMVETKSETAEALLFDDDGCVILRKDLFYEWRCASGEISRINSEAKLCSYEIDKALEAQPALRKLINDKASLAQSLSIARVEHQRVLEKLASYIGVASMKNISLDEKTGRVHNFDNNEHSPRIVIPPAPLNPKAKTKTKKLGVHDDSTS